ncbi:MAG TPA: hypothetical protein GXX33_08000 [Firmicutes bacterium]|nr:hypothetical protein [Bacillota bacterium]
MTKMNHGRLRNVLLALGFGLGLLVTDISGCLGLAATNTSFSVHYHWQLALPLPESLLNPEKMIPGPEST